MPTNNLISVDRGQRASNNQTSGLIASTTQISSSGVSDVIGTSPGQTSGVSSQGNANAILADIHISNLISIVEEAVKFLALDVPHGKVLPKGITPLAPTYFAPQPFGFVRPEA